MNNPCNWYTLCSSKSQQLSQVTFYCKVNPLQYQRENPNNHPITYKRAGRKNSRFIGRSLWQNQAQDTVAMTGCESTTNMHHHLMGDRRTGCIHLRILASDYGIKACPSLGLSADVTQLALFLVVTTLLHWPVKQQQTFRDRTTRVVVEKHHSVIFKMHGLNHIEANLIYRVNIWPNRKV